MEAVLSLVSIVVCLCGGVLLTLCLQGLNKWVSEQNDPIKPDTTLRYVISIFRHGVRSPGFPSFPTDPYKDRSVFFPEGKEALTKAGKQLMYRVGRTIRKRYNCFLRPTYTEEVYFVSTNIERTMMSAMLVSCGMFPPKQHQKWSENIDWQPIPVWLDNNQTDKTSLWMDSTPCPRFKNDSIYLETLSKQPDNAPDHDFYEYISKHTGDTRNSVYDVFALWDILECQRQNGFILPKWTQKIYPDKIKEMVAETFNLMVNGSSSMLKIFSGPLYHHIYDLLRTKVNGNLTKGQRIYLHSGHDISVLSFLRGIDYKPLLIVKPGDSIFLELHCSSDIYHVKLFYLSLLTSGEVFRELPIPRCPHPCHLSTFLTLATPLSPQEWVAECNM